MSLSANEIASSAHPKENSGFSFSALIRFFHLCLGATGTRSQLSFLLLVSNMMRLFSLQK